MNKLAQYYDNKVKCYKPSKIRELKITELLPINLKNLKILDTGCADGTFGAKLTKQGATVYGVDISPLATKIAKKKLKDAFVVDLNNQKLPFSAKYFDLIIVSEVIEHLFNPKNLLLEVKRVLKDNGRVILTTPNFLYWGNRIKYLFGNFKYEKSGVFDESHVHFYTYTSLKAELQESGFKIIRKNHVYAGSNTLKTIKDLSPSLFSYQIVILSGKK